MHATTVRPPPNPAYPDPGARPAVLTLAGTDIDDHWMLPNCTGWTSPGAKVLVALAASFRDESSVDDLAGRFGAITKLRAVQYWSVSDRNGTHSSLTTVDGPEQRRRREDFAAAEMVRGPICILSSVTADRTRRCFIGCACGRNASTGSSWKWRMRARSLPCAYNISAWRSPVRLFPGPPRAGTLGYYSLLQSVAKRQNLRRLADGHEESYVNQSGCALPAIR
jgi:hypothetical protein